MVSVVYVFGKEVLNVRKGRTGPIFGLKINIQSIFKPRKITGSISLTFYSKLACLPWSNISLVLFWLFAWCYHYKCIAYTLKSCIFLIICIFVTIKSKSVEFGKLKILTHDPFLIYIFKLITLPRQSWLEWASILIKVRNTP